MVKTSIVANVGTGCLLLFASVETIDAAWAEPAIPDSTAAMVRLQMPLGGRSTALSQATFTMNFGYWRHAAGPGAAPDHRFTPALQAGWLLSGPPVLRVGALDARRAFLSRANAQADGESASSNTRFVWIGLGVIAAGAAIGVAVANSDDDDKDCVPILPPPGQTAPCGGL